MSFPARSCVALLTAAFLLPQPSFAFETPLSDQAVREAYFLGQRRDESMARLLNRYTRFLPTPALGPHISSVSFLTPFALLVRYSSRQSFSSAQQAEKDHHAEDEIVSIQIELELTQSYGPFITRPTGSRSGSPLGIQLRSPGFWRSFTFRVFDGDEEITTSDLSGEPHHLCSEGGCTLTGATVRLQFPATAFMADTATVDVIPPEGDSVSVDFDLTSLR
ncbi:MAG TPA: hypothetical protein VEI73_02400 [Candidatus Acidoferrum sp.]|nr:hypothetical protein [Candidatus Acidoferrum sp.]